MKYIKAIFIYVLLASSMTVYAQFFENQIESSDSSAEYHDCVVSSGGAKFSMLACQDKEIQYQRQQLKNSYQRLSNILNEKSMRKLDTLQKEWERSTNSTCNFYNVIGDQNYTLVPIKHKNCFIRSTIERIDLIEYWIKMVQSDQGAPGRKTTP